MPEKEDEKLLMLLPYRTIDEIAGCLAKLNIQIT